MQFLQLLLLLKNQICLVSFFMLIGLGQCQRPLGDPRVQLTDADTVGYRFVNQEENRIENAAALAPFFKKLYEQRVFGGRKIAIVHLGDSHILGDYLTREMRNRLQKAFGDAGRGLVFPYKIAGTNGPTDYLMETNCRWQSQNCQRNQAKNLPVGLTGFSLTTPSTNGYLGFRLRDTASADSKYFTKMTIFRPKTEKSFDFEIRDEQGGQSAHKVLEGDHSVSFYFDRPTEQAILMPTRRQPDQKEICLNGISLENEMAGVLYHTVGINGARFSDFSRARYLPEQVSELFPDLIILSFGTNEAADPSLGEKTFYNQIHDLVEKLKNTCPGAIIMLTTPADSYYRGKGFNPRMATISQVLRRYAEDNSLAMWDLHKIGGGENSAANWKGSGLMSHDSIHYSKLGYAVQGKLFYQSMVNGYNNFWSGQ